MPSNNPQFVNGEFYHIVNRAIEGRNLFQQVADYFRFIFCLYELNDKNIVDMRLRINQRKARNHKNYEGLTFVDSREALVEIIVFCLMPNHYHLLIKQLKDNGISLFMKKLGDGYVGYFNEKYKRRSRGSIFQGHFKAVHIKTQEQLMNLICYIFTNPISLLEKNWKTEGVKNPQKAIKFLENYKWFSYPDCVGGKAFPSVTQRDFIYEAFGNSENLRKNVEDWILYKSELEKGLEANDKIFVDNYRE